MGRFDKLYKSDVPHQAVAVYLYLVDRANRKGQCWPAIPTIAREIKLSVSTVRRAKQPNCSPPNSGIGLTLEKTVCFLR